MITCIYKLLLVIFLFNCTKEAEDILGTWFRLGLASFLNHSLTAPTLHTNSSGFTVEFSSTLTVVTDIKIMKLHSLSYLPIGLSVSDVNAIKFIVL